METIKFSSYHAIRSISTTSLVNIKFISRVHAYRSQHAGKKKKKKERIPDFPVNNLFKQSNRISIICIICQKIICIDNFIT